MRLAAVLAVAVLALSAHAYVSFAGDIVYRVTVKDAAEAARLSSVIEELRLDQWSEANGQVDVRVQSVHLDDFARQGFNAEVLIADLEERTIAERVRLAARKRQFAANNMNEFFEDYHTYDEIVAFFEELAGQYPNLLTIDSIGRTYEGRDLVTLRITGPNNNATKGFFFNGGQHAREWISPATVTGLAYNLVTLYDTDALVRYYVDNIQWTIVPVLNPDGYQYTWDSDRLWRKNREPNQGAACVGTDVNRNWGYQWNTGGSSAQPCSDTYMGPEPLSAAENSAVIADLTAQLSSGIDVNAYIDFHAYSQLWMHPWGWTCDDLTDDDDDQQAVDDAAATAIRTAGYNTVYTTGPVCRTIYQASGGSNDHTYSLGIKYSFAVELRDTGRYGFELPADQIVESIEETWEGLLVVADAVLSN